jgi:hypothetical protein
MEQAKVYLGSKLDSLERPFAVSITSYALSLTSPGGDAASTAQTKLRALAHCDNGQYLVTLLVIWIRGTMGYLIVILLQ